MDVETVRGTKADVGERKFPEDMIEDCPSHCF